MRKLYRFIAVCILATTLFSLFSCAPMKLQGKFNSSFSLTERKVCDDQYEFVFYGDGQGTEKNTANGSTVFFTYTVFNGSLTVTTEKKSFVYEYQIEDKKDFNLTYQQNGQEESVLLVKK